MCWIKQRGTGWRRHGPDAPGRGHEHGLKCLKVGDLKEGAGMYVPGALEDGVEAGKGQVEK